MELSEWSKLNRFRQHKGELYFLTTTQPVKFPQLAHVPLSNLPWLDLDQRMDTKLTCKHEWATEERATRAADEMVTIFKYCIKCNYTQRHG